MNFTFFWGGEIGWMVHFGVHSFSSCFENFEASPDDAKWLIFIPKMTISKFGIFSFRAPLYFQVPF